METLAPEIVDLEAQDAFAVRGDVPFADLPDFFGSAFGKVMAAVEETGVGVAGAPFGYYPAMPTDTVVVEAGMPVSGPAATTGEVHHLVLPAGRAVVAVHVGPYDTLEQTYEELQRWMEEHELVPAGAMWEVYLTDPSVDTDPSTWRTRIVWPLA